MPDPYFRGDTFDDVLHDVIEHILATGENINPTKGPAKELSGVLLEISNPRARISRTETKGKPFSCLGELLWYLAKTNDLGFITYYIPLYKSFSDDGQTVFGGYGPRLFNWRGMNQFAKVADMLRKKPDSRQAVIQLFDAQDTVTFHKDIPCTCTLQFMIRQNQLNMFTYMRSNDVFVGLPHDIFSFTMLQEIMARTLSVGLGWYKHAVGSLHLYAKSVPNAQRLLGEGWQPTALPMPPMPKGDPQPAIDSVLHAEHSIRTGQSIDTTILSDLDPYWADLIRLLQVFRLSKDGDSNSIQAIGMQMSSSVYRPFISGRLNNLS